MAKRQKRTFTDRVVTRRSLLSWLGKGTVETRVSVAHCHPQTVRLQKRQIRRTNRANR